MIRRRCVTALVLAAAPACNDLGPVTDGVSQVRIRFRHHFDDKARMYAELRYTVRLAGPPLLDSQGVAVKAACQVEGLRLVAAEPPGGVLEQGKAVALESRPFLIMNDLPATPAMCELEMTEVSYKDKPRVLGRFCARETVVPGACPPNHLAGQAGPTGVTVELTSVTAADADSLGFPAHLTVAYTVTAYRDMAPGSYLVRSTQCPASMTDDTWHSELATLRAGESFTAAQNTYRLGRPSPGARCETRFGYSPVVNGEITEVARFCHVDGTITPGPCP